MARLNLIFPGIAHRSYPYVARIAMYDVTTFWVVMRGPNQYAIRTASGAAVFAYYFTRRDLLDYLRDLAAHKLAGYTRTRIEVAWTSPQFARRRWS